MTAPAFPPDPTSNETAAEFNLGSRPAGIAALLSGNANVIMQLSHRPVAYGVMESRVEGGQGKRHPIKRARTTLSFLAVAILGTDNDREYMRAEIDRQHRMVRSTTDSPVKYNAFDPQLQLWVAACLYWGAADAITKICGPFTDAEAEAFYRLGARFGTTLQVRPGMWPPDRVTFEKYWATGQDMIVVDDTAREWLYDLATIGYLPLPIRALFGPIVLFFTTGFLPPRFRRAMRLDWSDRQQRRFERILHIIDLTTRPLPSVVKLFPFNLLLWDVRRRARHALPIT
ncbi:oxygenase MpaB family protein [Nocardia sp. NPDC046763]|uniref:oxygenase MpaB family protein n=1 Tax=Nocardia sp. NPDC046763 TaxID=3155256 RepID=UPI0034104E79